MSRPTVLDALRGSGLDTSVGAAFLQARIALCSCILAVITSLFLLTTFVVATSIGMPIGDLLREPSTLAHLGGTLMVTAVWLIARSGKRTMPTLEMLDAGSSMGIGLAWAMLINARIPDSIYWGVVASILTLLARAIIVPSSSARTLRISLLSVLPVIVTMSLWLHDYGARVKPDALQPSYATFSYELLTMATAVFMAVTTSRLFYELRRKVKEANEVGPYSLEERLGAGGMGEVWRARHRFLVRAAAVKLIRPEVLASGKVDPELIFRRFEREARATAALRSPHTVQLYDFGQAEDGSLFYVMEMLSGLDLEKLVGRGGPVPAERAVHILKQVCHSLAEAHQNGLIHRDVKPANVFVSCVGTDTDFVKVLDFGLVRLHRESDSVNLTQENAMGGTPAYAAPEIVLGEATYDHRVDIYAVGCVAFWLCTGKLVFEGDTAMKVMLDHARTAPPRPQSKTELPIPPELEQIILDCLEKDPARRPQTATILANRLDQVPLSQPWTAERAERWWRSHLPNEIKDRPVADILLSRESAPRNLHRRSS